MRSLVFTHVDRARAGWPLLEKGFRPFFLLGAIFAVFGVPLWILALHGGVQPGGALGAMQWHAHEMLFGFTCAVIAGFLLTAASNWSGRETVTPWQLAALAVLWALGRIALLIASTLPRFVPALLDLLFLPALALACALPLFKAKNRRNYGFVGLLVAMSALNGVAHWAALRADLALVRLAHRGALDLIVVMMVLISGRIVPMFTRNATQLTWVRGIRPLEWGSLIAVVLLTLCDLLSITSAASTALAGTAAVLLFARMRFWGTRHTARQPLLWILHVGVLWIPIGLMLRVAAALSPSVPAGSALHALTAGAIGSLTLGMMARVSLGHTGRQLALAPRMTLAFACLLGASVIRVSAPFFPGSYLRALTVAASCWSIAFGIFLFEYWKILVSPRADAR